MKKYVARPKKNDLHVNHSRSGDLIAVADRDKWFSYYWWYEDGVTSIASKATAETGTNNSESESEEKYKAATAATASSLLQNDKAPTFTKTVDIHRKPC